MSWPNSQLTFSEVVSPQLQKAMVSFHLMFENLSKARYSNSTNMSKKNFHIPSRFWQSIFSVLHVIINLAALLRCIVIQFLNQFDIRVSTFTLYWSLSWSSRIKDCTFIFKCLCTLPSNRKTKLASKLMVCGTRVNVPELINGIWRRSFSIITDLMLCDDKTLVAESITFEHFLVLKFRKGYHNRICSWLVPHGAVLPMFPTSLLEQKAPSRENSIRKVDREAWPWETSWIDREKSAWVLG